MSNLFDQSHQDYRFDRKVLKLRKKIANRTAELGIHPDHTEDGHFYVYGGNKYPSVTKKLQSIKDPSIALWQKNRALEYVRENWNKETIEELIENAKQSPIKEFHRAGDLGSAVHAWREKWFNNWIKTDNDSLDGIDFDNIDYLLANQTYANAFPAATQAIIRCMKDFKAQPIACELMLADDKLNLGGCLDDLWMVDGKIWLVDLKTSSIGNKNSYYFQVALYWHMFRKLYKVRVDKLFILHTSKKIFGEYDLIELKDPKRYLQMAKNVLKLHDDIEELEQIKKPEIPRI